MTNDEKIKQVELNSEIYKALMESLAETAIFSVTDEKGNIILRTESSLIFLSTPPMRLLGKTTGYSNLDTNHKNYLQTYGQHLEWKSVAR